MPKPNQNINTAVSQHEIDTWTYRNVTRQHFLDWIWLKLLSKGMFLQFGVEARTDLNPIQHLRDKLEQQLIMTLMTNSGGDTKTWVHVSIRIWTVVYLDPHGLSPVQQLLKTICNFSVDIHNIGRYTSSACLHAASLISHTLVECVGVHILLAMRCVGQHILISSVWDGPLMLKTDVTVTPSGQISAVHYKCLTQQSESKLQNST